MLIHDGPRFRCTHCPKEFVQKSNLRRHIRQGEKLCSCNVVVYLWVGLLTLYYRLHLGIKPYKCDVCEKEFADKGACNSHVKTHTGEKHVSTILVYLV